MTKEQKAWIDAASYEELLRRWRFSKVGDPYFQGDTGSYFAMKMFEARKHCDDPVGVSKRVGWEVF